MGIQPAFQLAKDSPESNIDDVYEESGRWAPFRKLLRYYRHCIRSEEGADALAYQNQLGERFLYLRRSGSWLPRPGLPWRMSIPLGPHLAPFVGALPAPQAEETLVLGYPVWAFFKAKAGEPDVSLVRPIFYFQVEHSLTTSGIVLRLDATRPEVNLGWLESAFRLHPERRNAFLSACGFIEGRSVEDGAPEQDGNGQHEMGGVIIPFVPAGVWLAATSMLIAVLLLVFGFYLYHKNRIRALGIDSGDLAALASEKQLRQADVESLRHWMTAQQDELVRLRAEREEQERVRAELAHLEQACAAKDQENESLRKETGELESQRYFLQKDQERLSREVGDLEAKRQEADALKQQLDELRRQADNAQEILRQAAEQEIRLSVLATEKIMEEEGTRCRFCR